MRQRLNLYNMLSAAAGRFVLPWSVPVLGCLILLALSVPVTAEEELSREEYIAQFHDDLLAPCQSEKFVRCLGSSKAQCTHEVNQLVEACARALPKTMNKKNFEQSAAGYASCVFDGLQEAFSASSEQIGECETQAGMR